MQVPLPVSHAPSSSAMADARHIHQASAAAALPPAWGPWLACKFVEAYDYRAQQMRGGPLSPRPTLQPTVLQAVGHLAASAGGKTLSAAAQLAPPPADFLA